ncbi:MAG: electron transfer flavoprotein subunit beta/FixA family protein, partial [Desulfohalobiaceae bacterium]|nr:electron transfer flavoprotein subunit beta/FixA family protein [Desulfohalobiaceae bacterium]
EQVTQIINPYDEHCLTEAARIRDNHPGSEVISVTLGPESAREVLRSALAMGADRGILIKSDHRHDSIQTARALKAAIDRDKTPDIVLMGRESIDSCGMQTMFRLAALYQMPVMSNVVYLSIQNDKAQVTVEAGGGSRFKYALDLPCVLGAGKGLNKPRYPMVRDIMMARKKEIETVDYEDLDLGPAAGSMELVSLKPVYQDRTPQPISGEIDEQIEKLIAVLEQEARVI